MGGLIAICIHKLILILHNTTAGILCVCSPLQRLVLLFSMLSKGQSSSSFPAKPLGGSHSYRACSASRIWGNSGQNTMVRLTA